jgi:hypothetical protein
MRYIAALVIFASLVLPTKSATANVLSPGDYENFRNLDLKMLSIGDDISDPRPPGCRAGDADQRGQKATQSRRWRTS